MAANYDIRRWKHDTIAPFKFKESLDVAKILAMTNTFGVPYT